MKKLAESKSMRLCVSARKGFCTITDPLVSIALGARIFGGKKSHLKYTWSFSSFYNSLPLFALLSKTSWY